MRPRISLALLVSAPLACSLPLREPHSAEDQKHSEPPHEHSPHEHSPHEDIDAHAASALWLPEGDSRWKGKMDGAEVMFELRNRGGSVGGRYYSENRAHSLPLSGALVGQTLLLGEHAGKGDAFFGEESAQLQVTWDGERARGTRRTIAQDENEVSLVLEPTRLEYDELRTHRKPAVFAQGETFSYVQVHSIEEHLLFCDETAEPPTDLELIPGLTILEDECHWAFKGKEGKRVVIEANYLELHSDNPHFRVTEASKLVGKDEIKAGHSWGGSYRSTVLYAGGYLLSIERQTDGLGIGAYPAHDLFGFSIDMRTGKPLSTQELLDVPSVKEFYRDLEAELPSRPLADEDSTSCQWSTNWLATPNTLSGAMHVHITPKGLHITPDFPHVMKACQYENYARLAPLKFAKKYAREGGILDKLLQGHWGQLKSN